MKGTRPRTSTGDGPATGFSSGHPGNTFGGVHHRNCSVGTGPTGSGGGVGNLGGGGHHTAGGGNITPISSLLAYKLLNSLQGYTTCDGYSPFSHGVLAIRIITLLGQHLRQRQVGSLTGPRPSVTRHRRAPRRSMIITRSPAVPAPAAAKAAGPLAAAASRMGVAGGNTGEGAEARRLAAAGILQAAEGEYPGEAEAHARRRRKYSGRRRRHSTRWRGQYWRGRG